MKIGNKGLWLLFLPLLAFTMAHKFYVSVTSMVYVEKDDAIQITSRLFIDDLEKTLKERFDINAKMATPEELMAVNDYLEKYLKSKFVVYFDGIPQPYTFIGKKYDNDVVVCYLELTKVNFTKIRSISVRNEILADMFEEQQNVLHFKFKGKNKSFVLTRDNNKGMLNLE